MEKLIGIDELKAVKKFSKWFDNKEVIAITQGDLVKVFSGMCPHQGGPLGEGTLGSNTISCPWHGCTFDINTGNCIDAGTCIGASGMSLIPIPFFQHEGTLYVEITL